MRLSSKCYSNLWRVVLICLIDFSLIVMCVGETSSSNYLADISSVENVTLMTTSSKYPEQIATTTATPVILTTLFSNSTSVVPRTRRRRRKQQGRNRKRRKGTIQSTDISIRDGNGYKNDRKPVFSGNRKDKRRRRKLRKRKRKPKGSHNNVPEIATAIINKINEYLGSNFSEYQKELTDKASNNSLFANLVGPFPVYSESPNVTTILLKSGKQREGTIRKSNKCKKHNCAHICHPERIIRCSCLHGFYLAKDGKSCKDINECKIHNGGCESTCTNTLGSYECSCPKGLRLSDDLKTCEDINECLLRNGHGPCQGTCKNLFGSYSCSCAGLRGTELAADGHSCADLDECAVDNGGCSHRCINTPGRAFCSCPEGLELSDDWRTCQDINECEDKKIKKSCQKGCLNTVGSYHCLGSSDYQQDEARVNSVCKPLFPPSKGFIRCSRRNAFQSFTKRGRKRIINSPGTVCELICPRRYKITKKYHVMCGLDGIWLGDKDGKCVERNKP